MHFCGSYKAVNGAKVANCTHVPKLLIRAFRDWCALNAAPELDRWVVRPCLDAAKEGGGGGWYGTADPVMEKSLLPQCGRRTPEWWTARPPVQGRKYRLKAENIGCVRNIWSVLAEIKVLLDLLCLLTYDSVNIQSIFWTFVFFSLQLNTKNRKLRMLSKGYQANLPFNCSTSSVTSSGFKK